jgi:hypothetical protein
MTRRNLLAKLFCGFSSLFGGAAKADNELQGGLKFHKQFEESLTRTVGEDKVVKPQFDLTKLPYPHFLASGADALAKEPLNKPVAVIVEV